MNDDIKMNDDITNMDMTADTIADAPPTILITGASGFVGSFLVEEGLRRGFAVWAGVRASSSRRYLGQPELRFAELDFAHPDRLTEQLRRHREEHGPWDYIVHCAGVTKCRDSADFFRGNTEATQHFVEALHALDMVPRRFVYISSLSVVGPAHEADYADITTADTPRPNTAYGVSKLRAEEYLRGDEALPWVILRPTGIYGPREKDYFLMAQSIRQHVDFAAGWKRQDITFIYVKDLVQAVYASLTATEAVHRTYHLSDGSTYNSREFSDLLRAELGHPWMIRIQCPLALLKVISVCCGKVAGWMGKSSTLNPDKYNIMKQRNWRCDIRPARQDLGFNPRYPLARGVKEAMDWYKQEGWI
jgi:nucleoside-diphosphate-sugar epimerase